MYKILFTFLLLVLSFPIVSYAQKEISFRSMAVDQLYDYGQEVYNRGDYNQAAKIFSRVLSMQPDHEGSLSYAGKLKAKGKDIIVVPFKSEQKVASKAKIDFSKESNADLKQAIHAADQAVDTLKSDIAQLRLQIDQMKNENQSLN